MGAYSIGRVHGGHAQRWVVDHRLTRCARVERKAVQLDSRSRNRPRRDGVKRPWQCVDVQMRGYRRVYERGEGLAEGGERGGILEVDGEWWPVAGEVRARDRHRRRP